MEPAVRARQSTDELQTVGQRLRWIMLQRSVKQVDLAAKIGRTQASISLLVNDRSRAPSHLTLLMLAEVLGFRPLWLLHGTGVPWEPGRSPDMLRLMREFDSLRPADRRQILSALRELIAARRAEGSPG